MPPPRLRWPVWAPGEPLENQQPGDCPRPLSAEGGGHPAPTRGSGACPCPSSAEARAPHFGVLLACLGRGWAAAGACPSPIPEGSGAEGPLRSPLEVLVLPDDPGEPPGQLESGEPWRQGVSGCARQTQPGRPGSAGTGPGPPRAWIHSGGGGGGGVTGPAPSACTLVRAQGHGGRGWAGRRQGDLEWAVSAGWGFPGRRGGRGRVEHKSPWSLENSTNHPILFGKSSFFFKVRRLAQQRGGRGSYGGGCARPPACPA